MFGFWPKGGDDREPCVSPLMDGMVCDDAMEYSEPGVDPYGLLIRGNPELYGESVLLVAGPSVRAL